MNAKGFSLLGFLWFCSSFSGIFSVNLNPLFNNVVGHLLWERVVCSSLKESFSEVLISDYGAYVKPCGSCPILATNMYVLLGH